MKIESKVRIIEAIEAILVLSGYAVTGGALAFPSVIQAYLKDAFTDLSEQKGLMVATDRGESATADEKDIYFENSAAVTVKVFTGIFILTNVIMTTLFILLCLGIHKKRTGKLATWLCTHGLFLVFATLLIVGSATGSPRYFIYQIPNVIYQCYRLITLHIVYKFRKSICRQRSPERSED